ncbi:2'-5' RNA ligase family protein [Nannocystis pusilla]|uniref:2'-5' RNA ligase family protein n=1 Tax=Nannocystis pusilla TaxID=889268 RepID=UPI003B794688
MSTARSSTRCRSSTARRSCSASRGWGCSPRGLPTSVWAGLVDTAPLLALRQKVDACLRKVPDVPPDPRKFIPHVTIARTGDCELDDVMVYLTEHSLMRTELFPVERVLLFSSTKTHHGSAYRIEAAFPLRPV